MCVNIFCTGKSRNRIGRPSIRRERERWSDGDSALGHSDCTWESPLISFAVNRESLGGEGRGYICHLPFAICRLPLVGKEN